MPLNWCVRIVGLEKTLESPLDSKESQPVNPKGDQPWIFIGRTDAEAETPIRWPPDGKSWLTGKDPDAGEDWEQEEKGMAEDEMVGWHHRLNGLKTERMHVWEVAGNKWKYFLLVLGERVVSSTSFPIFWLLTLGG